MTKHFKFWVFVGFSGLHTKHSAEEENYYFTLKQMSSNRTVDKLIKLLSWILEIKVRTYIEAQNGLGWK